MPKRTDVLPATALAPLLAYVAWRKTDHGREVYQMCSEIAARLVLRHFSNYGIKGIVETARWHYSIKHGPDADGFKISNTYTAYLAREMMMKGVVPLGFFRQAQLRSIRNPRYTDAFVFAGSVSDYLDMIGA